MATLRAAITAALAKGDEVDFGGQKPGTVVDPKSPTDHVSVQKDNGELHSFPEEDLTKVSGSLTARIGRQIKGT